jgi:hypothetical protein
MTCVAKRPPPPQVIQLELLKAAEERSGYIFAFIPLASR